MHENDHQHRLRGFKLIISTSFSESVFQAWVNQKNANEDLIVKGKYRVPPWYLCGKTLEGSRSHVTEAMGRRLLGGAARPHLQAARSPGPTYQPPL